MIASFSKKLGLLLALTAVLPASAIAEKAADKDAKATTEAAKPADAPIAINDATVVAKVTIDGKNVEITFGQLKEQLKSLPANIQGAPIKEIYEPLLQNAINLAIITAKAKNQGLEKDAEVARRIAECQEAMLQKTFLEREVAKLQTTEELKKAYDEVIKILPKVDQVRLSQAIFKTEADAKKFIDAVKKSSNFEAALKEAKESGKEVEGGDMDYIRMDALPPDIAKEVTKAAKATLIAKPIAVELAGNKLFFVIRVNDKSPAPQPTFEQLEPELKQITFQKFAKMFWTK
ncbi:peptidylprolyl isomerase [Candidatus Paracaedibacter symbiosus]|uniref:peptidylprolyl isomerase n=1 Tax=Candidatus Paracaedibacter symbiosus TaxID=244582 RepID=UPI0005094E39|nr:peptidylprolyl isomerase [Candidatus Paracaedibacter symbiosus]